MSIYGVDGSSSGSMAEVMAQLRNSGNQQQGTQGFATSFVSDHDTDGDGALSIGETDFSEEMFSSIDTDGDGVLSADELAAEEQRRQQQGKLNMAMRDPMNEDVMTSDLISQFDTDGDGQLSQAELDMDENLFNLFDSDDDGLLSQEEISAGMRADKPEPLTETKKPAASLEEESAEEIPTAQASGGGGNAGAASGDDEDEEYDEMDLNKDGIVSFEELRIALMQTMQDTESTQSLFGSNAASGSSFMRRLADSAYQQQANNGMQEQAAAL